MRALDPETLAAAVAALVALTLVGSMIPPPRAAGVDPATVLRRESGAHERRDRPTAERGTFIDEDTLNQSADLRRRLSGRPSTRDGVVLLLCLLQPGCQSQERRAATLAAKVEQLEDRMAGTAAAHALLDDVEVVEAQFLGRVENRPGTAEFKLTVENKTEHLIQRIRFEAVLAVPGSSDPLLKGRIDGNTPGGVDPGKRLSFVMFPMPGSPWDAYDPPEGAVLRLTPIRLVGIGGNVLAEARSPERQSRDRASLDALRAELDEIQPRSR